MIKTAIKRCLNLLGYEIQRLPKVSGIRQSGIRPIITPTFDKIHYACGLNRLVGWLNVDVVYGDMRINLADRHPFPDNVFRYGFAEDFLEHLDQHDSLIFLVEAYRTLRSGGVLRLSFPSMEALLFQHFLPASFEASLACKRDAYIRNGHRHFYSRDGIALVAKHIGFDVEFVEVNVSHHPELCGLDTRVAQSDNIRVELKKR